MKKLIHFLLFFLVIDFSYCQKANVAPVIDSLWTSPSLGSYEPQSLTIAPDGTLIAMSREKFKGIGNPMMVLTGISTETGAVKWKYPKEFVKDQLDITDFQIVPNTPFIIPIGPPVAVIDPSDGRVLVDAVRENIQNIEDYGFLLQSGHAWVSGWIDGEKSLSVFDLRTGKKLYSNTEVFKEKSKAAAKLNKLAALTGGAAPGGKGGMIKQLCAPINDGKDYMILATGNGIFRSKISTGEIDWTAELPDINKGKAIKVEQGIDMVRLMPGRGETFFVIKPSYMIAMNYSDGKPAWKDLVKTSGPIDQIIYDEKGLILCPGSSNSGGVIASGYVKLVDEKTGSELWGEGIKFNGGIKNYLYTEKGLAVAMVNSATSKNSINFIDVAAGKFALPKNVNVDGWLQYLELTPKGLLYKTDREVNIIGLETDKPLLKVPVQSKKDRAILSANAQDHFYFYSDDDGALYDINKKDGTAKVLNKSDIKFQGGELPIAIDLRADGVCLYSAQNLTLITFDGATKYSTYNPGVRTFESVMNKIIAVEDKILAIETLVLAPIDIALVSSEALVVSAISPQDQAAQRNQYSQLQQAFAEVGNATFLLNMNQFKNVKGRLSASAQSANEVYMMTKVDDRTVLLGVNKDSGQPVSKVPLAKRDKEPLYELDQQSGYLYYAPKGKNLIGWSKDENSVTGYRTPMK